MRFPLTLAPALLARRLVEPGLHIELPLLVEVRIRHLVVVAHHPRCRASPEEGEAWLWASFFRYALVQGIRNCSQNAAAASPRLRGSSQYNHLVSAVRLGGRDLCPRHATREWPWRPARKGRPSSRSSAWTSPGHGQRRTRRRPRQGARRGCGLDELVLMCVQQEKQSSPAPLLPCRGDPQQASHPSPSSAGWTASSPQGGAPQRLRSSGRGSPPEAGPGNPPQQLTDSLLGVGLLQASGSGRSLLQGPSAIPAHLGSSGTPGTPFSAQDIALLSNRSRATTAVPPAAAAAPPLGLLGDRGAPSPTAAAPGAAIHGSIGGAGGGQPSGLQRSTTPASSCMEYESPQPSRAASPAALTLQLSTGGGLSSPTTHRKQHHHAHAAGVGAAPPAQQGLGTEQVALQGHGIPAAAHVHAHGGRHPHAGAAAAHAPPDRWHQAFMSGAPMGGVGGMRRGGQVRRAGGHDAQL